MMPLELLLRFVLLLIIFPARILVAKYFFHSPWQLKWSQLGALASNKQEKQKTKILKIMCIVWWYHLVLFFAEQRGYSTTLQRNIMGPQYQKTCKRVEIMWCHCSQTLSWQYY